MGYKNQFLHNESLQAFLSSFVQKFINIPLKCIAFSKNNLDL